MTIKPVQGITGLLIRHKQTITARYKYFFIAHPIPIFIGINLASSLNQAFHFSNELIFVLWFLIRIYFLDQGGVKASIKAD
jgi:hypothetical protein